jgi:isopentenyl diphosphate isomerase/L-lactate dehydrogenase-like FMN-dependent dehydrogenase
MFADTLVTELKSTMFLVGANNLDDLKKARYFVTGHLKEAISN